MDIKFINNSNNKCRRFQVTVTSWMINELMRFALKYFYGDRRTWEIFNDIFNIVTDRNDVSA